MMETRTGHDETRTNHIIRGPPTYRQRRMQRSQTYYEYKASCRSRRKSSHRIIPSSSQTSEEIAPAAISSPIDLNLLDYNTTTTTSTRLQSSNCKSRVGFTTRHTKYLIQQSQYYVAKTILCLYVLQQLASLCQYHHRNYHYHHHHYPHHHHPSLIRGLSFVLADHIGQESDGYHHSRNIDKLLNQNLNLSGQLDLKPLDIIKYKSKQDEQLQKHHHQHHQHHHHRNKHHNRHNTNHHHHRRHHSHNHDHNQKSRLGEISQQYLQDKQMRHEQQSTDHRTGESRKKRHNAHKITNGYFDPVSGINTADRPVVATRKGLLRGITQKTVTGKYVDAFLGIPFAQPPVGRYRFRHPQPVNPWSGELDASKFSSSCYQINDTFFGANFLGTSIWNANTPLSEDCLYLNIWTPFGVANTTIGYNMSQQRRPAPPDPIKSKTAKRPVLVWIFGGGFYYGTSSLALYDGGPLASEEDIIVVSMNYRVSALGFLYFGRSDAPGNAGLFDQLLALQWINDNIDQFGGDPERVTIFGESAGAVSVAYHLLSPLSRNLFSQAILQSGAATCPWGLMDTNEIIANGLQLASLLNCPANQSDLEGVLECLLKADPMALVSQEVGQTRSILNFPFVPVVDGSFLLEPPAESLAKANFKQAKILLGSNYDEGNAFLIYLPEFSHCPSTGSNGGSVSSGGQTVVPSTSSNLNQQHQQQQQGDTSETSTNTISPSTSGYQSDPNDNPNVLMSELRDQPQPGSPIESLDLVAASGGQRAPSTTKSNEHQQHAMNQQQQQQIDLSNDSKPCKPIDDLMLSREDFFHVLKEDLNPYAEHPVGKEAIVFEYSNWNNPLDPVSNYDAIDKIVGDYYFTCHVNEFAQQFAQAGNAVYMYYFKQRSSISSWPKWMGVLHGDEINFVFGEPLNQMYNYTPKEVELSRRMMKYWANFAKFGNPTKNGDNSSMAEKWPEYGDKKQYFELHSDHIRIGRGPRAKQCAFWASYLPRLIQTFDKHQCLAREGSTPVSSLIHPFATPSYAAKNYFGQSQPHLSPFNTIPSALLIGLLVILLLASLGATVYLVRSRRSSSSTWKLGCPLGSGGGSGNDGAGSRGGHTGGSARPDSRSGEPSN